MTLNFGFTNYTGMPGVAGCTIEMDWPLPTAGANPFGGAMTTWSCGAQSNLTVFKDNPTTPATQGCSPTYGTISLSNGSMTFTGYGQNGAQFSFPFDLVNMYFQNSKSSTASVSTTTPEGVKVNYYANFTNGNTFSFSVGPA